MRLTRRTRAHFAAGSNFYLNARGETEALTDQLLCPICGKAVVLETAKTDEHGKAIHDDCYLLKLRLRQACSVNYLQG